MSNRADSQNEALTFDDVLLVPQYSEILPHDIEVRTELCDGVTLELPLVSAAMDTVTESRTAIVMAQHGGFGVIHRNLSVEAQAKEVEFVKKYESGMIVDPITAAVDTSIRKVVDLMLEHHISGVPIVDKGRLVGIVTNRDLRFVANLDQPITKVMTKDPVTVPQGTTLDRAKELLHERRIEKLPVVNDSGELVGLITSKDIEKSKRHPLASKDERGQLLVGAAVGVGEGDQERVDALVEKNVNLVVVDLAHGHAKRLIDFMKEIRRRHADVIIVAGNVASADAVTALAKAGANIVKVGIGPGSICTTRIIAGVGVPQLTAIQEAARAARKAGVSIIADGGIKFSGDMVKAFAAGAHAVMIGSLFAGTEESPGDTILYQGRTYKTYRGMGSRGAILKGDSSRYFTPKGGPAVEPVPEGIEGRVPYRGHLSTSIHQLAGGLRSGMAYVGACSLDELRKRAAFVRISNAGMRESHVHDVIITKEAPNYRPST